MDSNSKCVPIGSFDEFNVFCLESPLSPVSSPEYIAQFETHSSEFSLQQPQINKFIRYDSKLPLSPIKTLSSSLIKSVHSTNKYTIQELYTKVLDLGIDYFKQVAALCAIHKKTEAICLNLLSYT